MDISTILSCLCGPSDSPTNSPTHQCAFITEKPTIEPQPSSTRTAKDIATNIISIIRRAEKPDHRLTAQLDDAVGTTGWTDRLAEHVLSALQETLKGNHETWGEALSEAYDVAVQVADEMFIDLVEYVKEHPLEIAASILLTLVAFGVLVRLMPLVLELLGFGVEGPVEGSFAAWFQRTYGGYVPKGSIMSFLQRLGMTWAKE
ncbi:hypothetical protein OQA88_8467 [Cercophora sp. LCS_1]